MKELRFAVMLVLLTPASVSWGQSFYPRAGQPTGPRTAYFPAQPVHAQPVQAVQPVVAQMPVTSAVPQTVNFAPAAVQAGNPGWNGATWFPQQVQAAPQVTGFSAAPAGQAFIQPAGGGLVPATAAARPIARPLWPGRGTPLVAAPVAVAAPVMAAPMVAAPAQVTAFSPAIAPGAMAPLVAGPVMAAPVISNPAVATQAVTALSPVVANPTTGGFHPITTPNAAVSGMAPGYVAYSNPYARAYVPPVFAYRPVTKQVPVTFYRPVTTINPATGQPITTLMPCTGNEQQAWTARSVFAQQVPVAGGTCGPQGCNGGSCRGGTCGTPNPYYQPGPASTVVPGTVMPGTTFVPGTTVVPGSGVPAASIPPSLPSSTPVPSSIPPASIPFTPAPPATFTPAAPSFPGFQQPRTTIPPPSTVFPQGTSGFVAPPTTSTFPGRSPADSAPQIPPNFTPSNPVFGPNVNTGSQVDPPKASGPADTAVTRSEGSSSTTNSLRPLIKIPYSGETTPRISVPAPPSTPSNAPVLNPTFTAPMNGPANGRTISEPGSAPRVTPVPDPDNPPALNRAPQLINPRDKTA